MQSSFFFRSAQPGQIDSILQATSIDSLFAALLPQVSTVVVGGNGAGTYTIQIEGAEGIQSFSFTAAAETVAQITDALAAAAAAEEGLNGMVSVSSDGVNTLTLAFAHPGFEYLITFPSNPSGNLSGSTAQAAQGRSFDLGIAVVHAGSQLARLPAPGDVALDFAGITVRGTNLLIPLTPLSTPLSPLTEQYQAPLSMPVMRQGSCWVRPEVAVAVNDPIFVRVTATGSEQFGALRNDADGGDAVQIPGRFVSAAAAGGVARIQLNLS